MRHDSCELVVNARSKPDGTDGDVCVAGGDEFSNENGDMLCCMFLEDVKEIVDGFDVG